MNDSIRDDHGSERRPTWRQAGQVFVVVALLLPVILGSVGLAVDLGVGYASRRVAQNTADAAAYGGTIIIIDNAPGVLTYNSQDVYNAFLDALQRSGAPQNVNLYDPTGACAGARTAPQNTLGTVDIKAQFLDANQGALTYLCNSSSVPIPPGGKGLRATVSWPQRTYFGAAVGWQTYNVGGVAAYLAGTQHFSQAVIAPFAVWWDPPYGPQNAADTTGQLGNTICFPHDGSVSNVPCRANGGDPDVERGYGPPVGTRVTFFDNGYKSDDPNDGLVTPTQDPDYQLGANDFKGYFGSAGNPGPITVCLGTVVVYTGNGNNGRNAATALQSALKWINSAHTIGYARFALVDQAAKNGSVTVNVYNTVILQVDTTQTSNQNGPWVGTVLDPGYDYPGLGNCSNGSGLTTPATLPIAIQ